MDNLRRKKSVYLAGPDVFLPNAIEIGEHKKRICEAYGLDGLFPLDNEVSSAEMTAKQLGFQIFLVNRSLMLRADLIIANMTPFRGPSADVGTAFEMGFMCSLGKPVFAYSNVDEPFLDRVLQFVSRSGEQSQYMKKFLDSHGMDIENFGLSDNLMLDGAVALSGTEVVCGKVPEDEIYTSQLVFEECVRRVIKKLPQIRSSSLA